MPSPGVGSSCCSNCGTRSSCARPCLRGRWTQRPGWVVSLVRFSRIDGDGIDLCQRHAPLHLNEICDRVVDHVLQGILSHMRTSLQYDVEPLHTVACQVVVAVDVFFV